MPEKMIELIKYNDQISISLQNDDVGGMIDIITGWL